MSMTLYAHPFSSYCQKVLVAFYEKDLTFDLRMVGGGEQAATPEFVKLWPMERMPVLVDDGRTVVESTIIIEHLDLKHPRPARLIPEDPDAALEPRMLDRFFDNYVMAPMQKMVFDRIRPEPERDARGVAEAKALLDKSYRWLDGFLAGREWASGERFTLADCAAAPALFYADWVYPLTTDFPNLRSYRQRLLQRPSFARAVSEARPFRGFFPGGAPDRD